MKIARYSKKTIIVFVTLVLALVTWYYTSNPASLLKHKQINEIGIYAIGNRTLWDYGYNPDNFDRAEPGAGDFQYNAIFKGESLNKVIASLKYPSKSYYTLSTNSESYQGLYIINIPISNEEGFTFITKDLNEESKGRFIGYKYKGKESGNKKWIEYNNPKLGQTLVELRSE